MSSRTHCIFCVRKITKNKNIKLNIENGVFYIGKKPCLLPIPLEKDIFDARVCKTCTGKNASLS
jgi:hypothetical protein